MWPAERALCPACGEPVLPVEWYRCVAVDRLGTRAHLGCLEAPHPAQEPGAAYLLAPRTTNPDRLLPIARFVALAGDSAVIAVCSAGGLDPSIAAAGAQGRLLGLSVPVTVYADVAAALAAARGESADLTTRPLPPAPVPLGVPPSLCLVATGIDRGTGLAHAILAWGPPAGGPMPHHYALGWRLQGDPDCVAEPAISPWGLTDLNPGAVYLAWVWAVDAAGARGPVSPLLTFATATP